MELIREIPDYEGACIYALEDQTGGLYIGSTDNFKRRIRNHVVAMGEVERGFFHKQYNETIVNYIKSGGFFTARILEKLNDGDNLEEAEQRHYDENKEKAIYNARRPTRTEKIPNEERGKERISISEYALAKGISSQAIYKKLSKRKIPLDTIRDRTTGFISESGLEVLEQLFAEKPQVEKPVRESVEKAREEQKQANADNRRKEQEKQLASLKVEVDKLNMEVEYLNKTRKVLEDEIDYLRRALDQAQQLHAMTMKQMLPPAPAERKGAFSWLTSRFKKTAPAADQIQTEQTGNNQ